jgi:hypothetical protein
MPLGYLKLQMKRKFSEYLTKRHRSTAEYFYVVTQSAVESEDAERGDFERGAGGRFPQPTCEPRNLTCKKKEADAAKESGSVSDVSEIVMSYIEDGQQ